MIENEINSEILVNVLNYHNKKTLHIAFPYGERKKKKESTIKIVFPCDRRKWKRRVSLGLLLMPQLLYIWDE